MHLSVLITTEEERIDLREYVTVSTEYSYPNKLNILALSAPLIYLE